MDPEAISSSAEWNVSAHGHDIGIDGDRKEDSIENREHLHG